MQKYLITLICKRFSTLMYKNKIYSFFKLTKKSDPNDRNLLIFEPKVSLTTFHYKSICISKKSLLPFSD